MKELLLSDMIKRISPKDKDKYGYSLIAMLEYYNVRGLKDLSYEEIKNYYLYVKGLE